MRLMRVPGLAALGLFTSCASGAAPPVLTPTRAVEILAVSHFGSRIEFVLADSGWITAFELRPALSAQLLGPSPDTTMAAALFRSGHHVFVVRTLPNVRLLATDLHLHGPGQAAAADCTAINGQHPPVSGLSAEQLIELPYAQCRFTPPTPALTPLPPRRYIRLVATVERPELNRLRESIAELDPGEAVDDLADRLGEMVAGSAQGGKRDPPRIAVHRF